MNTPAHLIFAAAAFGKPESRRVTWCALLGGLLPDLSLYVMAGVSLFILGIPPRIVFGHLYYSPAWQQVFAVDNSFVLWGIALAIALWRRVDWGVALCGAALLHLALDFPLHNHDARMHFWPLSEWKFISPVSYWDPNLHGRVVGTIEMALSAGVCIWLLRRFKEFWLRLVFVSLTLLELGPSLIWSLIF